MIFEFTAAQNFDFITAFSQRFNLPITQDYLAFPGNIGDGYIRKVNFGEGFRLHIHRYKLKEDFTIIRHPSEAPNDLVSIFFYNNENPLDLVYNKEKPVKFSRKNESAIQVTTNDLNSIIRFPAHHEIYYLVVGIPARQLATFLKATQPNNIIDTVTHGGKSFLYFESMTAETQRLLKHIPSVNMSGPLSSFYVQIKVQELLYYLFERLIQRENVAHKPFNNADAEKIMALRNIILSDLSQPPVLPALAARVGMSETKMKQLFKQTFGETIYNYYQKVRMEEAAFLLKQGGYSVSEVGYELGFTNLSHFSRLFQEYYGQTPKKYSVAG